MTDLKHIRNYYKKHAPFYDLTRPFFLFGRNRICNELIKILPKNSSVLEVGSGTGYLLNKLSKRNDLKLTGIDVSKEMIDRSDQNFELINSEYNIDSFTENSFDSILLSYIFTLEENDTDEFISNIKYHLKDNGTLAVVDFHNASPHYDRFMKSQNIIIDPELFERLKEEFECKYEFEGIAWFGIWRYRVMVLGKDRVLGTG